MKTIAIGICGVLLAGLALAECVEVQEAKLIESSRHVRAIVVLDGKPLKGVRVDFFKSTSQSQVSALTDEKGIATPTELPPGDYNVVATLDESVSTSILLRVTRDQKVTTFPMDLTGPVQQTRQLQEDGLKRAETLPVSDHLRAFQGTVLDPSGAMVPNATVRVVKRGAPANDFALRVTSDADGNFSGQLSAGSYIAFVSSQGFRTAIVPFEVVNNGSGDMKITLKIAMC